MSLSASRVMNRTAASRSNSRAVPFSSSCPRFRAYRTSQVVRAVVPAQQDSHARLPSASRGAEAATSTSAPPLPAHLFKLLLICAALYRRLSLLAALLLRPATLGERLSRALGGTAGLVLPTPTQQRAADDMASSSAAAAEPAASLAAEWTPAASLPEWAAAAQRASARGALLATVLVSDAAAAAYAPTLDRMRRTYGIGPDAPVHFVFVRVGSDFQARQAAAAAARPPAHALASAHAPNAGPAVPLAAAPRLSYTSSTYGLDVALAGVLPGVCRTVSPALLLSGGVAAGGAARWGAATRLDDMQQLLGDWAYINKRFAAAAAAAAPAASAAGVRQAPRGAAASGAVPERAPAPAAAVSGAAAGAGAGAGSWLPELVVVAA